jgi:hypothetical protein
MTGIPLHRVSRVLLMRVIEKVVIDGVELNVKSTTFNLEKQI